ncbi:MAG: glycine cleavage system protein GcvH [Geobacter sp.]|nr:glycine cleavage system protein GcvH [Geobacter sp.]
MSEFLETTHDKFIFKVKIGLYYSTDDYWVDIQGDQAVVGITDYLQKVSGDVAFIDTAALNTAVKQGDEAGTIESMKTVFGVIAPVSGKIVAVNPLTVTSPFLINQDPFDTGWIYRVQLSDWEADKATLLTAESYMALMKEKIEKEGK